MAERQSVGSFIDRWLIDVAKPSVSPKTFKGYSDHVRLHIKPFLGHIELTRLTPQHVQQLLYAKSEEGKSPGTVRAIRDCLRICLNVAMQWSLLLRNPATLVSLPKRRKSMAQAYNKAEAQKFIEAMRGHRLESLFLVSLCLGMRQGEVLGLRLIDLDLENSRLAIHQAIQRIEGKLRVTPTKTDASQRSIPLPLSVVSSLQAHLERRNQEQIWAGSAWKESGMVFTTATGTMIDARNLLREYYKLRQVSDLPKIRFHDLRHSAATLLHAVGVSTQMIRRLLGHSSTRTTEDIYSHVITDMEAQAAVEMANLLKPVAVSVAVKAVKH